MPETAKARAMITTLTGSNSYLLRSHLIESIQKFVEEYGELAVERIEAEDTEFNTIVAAINSSPFLSKRKLIIIENLSANKQAAEHIEQIISSINDDTDVIICEPVTDKRTVFYKSLKTRTDFIEFDEMAPLALAKWLVDEARNQGGNITQNDAVYLIERVGANQMLLASELQKIQTYNPSITRETINLLTEKVPQSKVFDLLDAAFSGDKSRALGLYEQQRTQRVEPREILAMLVWQLRLIVAAKLAQDRTPDQIAKDLGTSSFPVSKSKQLSQRLNLKDLQTLVLEVARIDRLSKTTSIDLDEALKNYITAL